MNISSKNEYNMKDVIPRMIILFARLRGDAGLNIQFHHNWPFLSFNLYYWNLYIDLFSSKASTYV